MWIDIGFCFVFFKRRKELTEWLRMSLKINRLIFDVGFVILYTRNIDDLLFFLLEKKNK